MLLKRQGFRIVNSECELWIDFLLLATAYCLLPALQAGGRQGNSQFRVRDCQLTTDNGPATAGQLTAATLYAL